MAFMLLTAIYKKINTLIPIFCAVFAVHYMGYAQDCSSPLLLCSEVEAVDFEPTGPPLNVGCFDAQNTAFFQFTTNTLVDPGTAVLNLETWNCDTVPTDFQLAVLTYNDFDPCDQTAYSVVGTCELSSIAGLYETVDLNPDTEYLVVIGTDTDTSINTCESSLSLSGTAVEIDACCDGEIALGDSYELSVAGGSDPIGPPTFDYEWGPPSNLEFIDDNLSDNPTVLPEQTTTFAVSATVGDCLVRDFVTVIVGPPISIPNTITPNGDNVNDFWLIGGIERFEAAAVTVYDRWGQIVFNTIGYTQPWDGTNEGSKLKTATYYYVIELNSTDVATEPLTGSITLIH